MPAFTEPVQQMNFVFPEIRVANADLLKSKFPAPAFDLSRQGQ
jgi:hypothetical protein